MPHSSRLQSVAVGLGLAFALLATPHALGQRGTASVRSVPYVASGDLGTRADALPLPRPSADGPRPVILLTGYWPPTNEMIRQFASDPALNANWVGADWEGRGYDVHAYFPEFNNPNCSNCGQGNGWLEVDYQDTVADFDALTALHRPVAIITFSRGSFNNSWEVEMNQINRSFWFNDYSAPFQPTPAPPDPSIATNAIRPSVQPVETIVANVAASVPGVNPAVCYTGNGGGFLSEFIAYLGVWYQDDHKDPLDPDWCVAAGHVHVGTQVSWPTATLAAEVTLRTVIAHVDDVLSTTQWMRHCSGATNSTGQGSSLWMYGSGSLSGELTRLMAEGLPVNQSGIFFYGMGQAQLPFGEGFRCAAAQLTRIPDVQTAGIGGRAWMNLDFTNDPLGSGASALTAGSTWSFQYWYRDASGGPLGFNASDALEITFAQ